MPTTRPRYQVTETDSVARALDVAAARWPGEPRSRLLLRLVEAGETAITDEVGERHRRQRQARTELAGKYTGAFPAGYLEELRRDWDR